MNSRIFDTFCSAQRCTFPRAETLRIQTGVSPWILLQKSNAAQNTRVRSLNFACELRESVIPIGVIGYEKTART